MRSSKRPDLLFIPHYLPNSSLQTSGLAITFPLFTQRNTPKVPFIYSIHRYLPNAPLQTSHLAITFPAIYPMRPTKRTV